MNEQIEHTIYWFHNVYPEGIPILSQLRAISWLTPTIATIDGLLPINQLEAGLKHVANSWVML